MNNQWWTWVKLRTEILGTVRWCKTVVYPFFQLSEAVRRELPSMVLSNLKRKIEALRRNFITVISDPWTRQIESRLCQGCATHLDSLSGSKNIYNTLIHHSTSQKVSQTYHHSSKATPPNFTQDPYTVMYRPHQQAVSRRQAVIFTKVRILVLFAWYAYNSDLLP